MNLSKTLQNNRRIRVVGFDDAPFIRQQSEPVPVAGVFCADTRFEGMLWGCIDKDGMNATRVLTTMLQESKFYEQTHVVLIDGIALGGFNVVDLAALADELDLPCIAVMRRHPDMKAIEAALQNLPESQLRMDAIRNAGIIHHDKPFYFQVRGCEPKTAARVLHQLTDQGHVPEALRIAHMIGAAVQTGQSGRRA